VNDSSPGSAALHMANGSHRVLRVYDSRVKLAPNEVARGASLEKENRMDEKERQSAADQNGEEIERFPATAGYSRSPWLGNTT
jgi:hypothetical protein